MDRKVLLDAVRPHAPGAKLKPEWVPMIDWSTRWACPARVAAWASLILS